MNHEQEARQIICQQKNSKLIKAFDTLKRLAAI
jgi:hypothetical protein